MEPSRILAEQVFQGESVNEEVSHALFMYAKSQGHHLNFAPSREYASPQGYALMFEGRLVERV
jgi:hypothetical protein